MTGPVLGGWTQTPVSVAEMERIRDRENPHAATRRRHGLTVLAPFVDRRSIRADEMPRARQALRDFGDLLDDGQYKTLADAVRPGISAHPVQPAANPAPSLGEVAEALRRLADRVEQGDAEAARAIIRAAGQ